MHFMTHSVKNYLLEKLVSFFGKCPDTTVNIRCSGSILHSFVKFCVCNTLNLKSCYFFLEIKMAPYWEK